MTTNPLPAPSLPASRMATTIRRMAKALVTETLVGASKPLPDMVIGIDDLELASVHQPEVVVEWLRRAVQESVAERYPSLDSAERARQALREHCSFHLLVPLAEAYFFGEDAALVRAGVPGTTCVHRLGHDVEDFETDDPGFLPLANAKNVEWLALAAVGGARSGTQALP